jgi:hypothetical protein
MPKTISDERVALRALPEPPANPKAITTEEWDAGIPLECRIMDYRLSATASDTVAAGELCEGTNAQAPGRSNYEGNITILRYLTGAGLSDAANDIAWITFKNKGTTLHLVEREGPEHDAEGTAGQEYSYYEVISDNPTKPTERTGFIRREVPLLVQRAAENKVLVAG